MAKYQTSVRTPWSRQRAYDYLRDLAHFSDWDPGITRSERVAGVSGEVGSTYTADLHLKGVLGLADPLLSLVFNRLGDRAAAGLRRQLDGVEA